MPLSITSHHHLSPTINMYSKEGAGDSGPDRHHTGDYLAPLASVDLSRVNTPGGSPSHDPAITPPLRTPIGSPRRTKGYSEPFNEGPPDRYCLVGNLTTHIVWSILVEVVVFVVTVVLVMVDSSDWPEVFLWIASVVILN
ncbi:hypothetical protein O3P69_014547, partial [Scylla paramamosain]